jgi:hypothetical protein
MEVITGKRSLNDSMLEISCTMKANESIKAQPEKAKN